MQVVDCMELFSIELPIRSDLMTSFKSRMRLVPLNIRPKVFFPILLIFLIHSLLQIYLDLSDTTDTWTERVTFELFADLCPTIVQRFIDYCQGTLYENGKYRTPSLNRYPHRNPFRRRHLRGTHVSIIDIDSIEFFPVEHNDENPAYVAIPPDCDETNDLLSSQSVQ